jgi:hypothetical protein
MPNDLRPVVFHCPSTGVAVITFRVGDLDLDWKPPMIELKQRIVRFIGGAAYGVADDDDAVAQSTALC